MEQESLVNVLIIMMGVISKGVFPDNNKIIDVLPY